MQVMAFIKLPGLLCVIVTRATVPDNKQGSWYTQSGILSASPIHYTDKLEWLQQKNDNWHENTLREYGLA